MPELNDKLLKFACEKHGEVETKNVGGETWCSLCYDEIVEGIKRGLVARKEGKLRPWSEVKKELDL